MTRRCLLLASSTSYRTEAFVDAAHRLGAEVVVGSNRCHELAEIYSDEAYAARGGYAGSLAIDFRDFAAATGRIAAAARAHAFDAIVATDDLTAVIAALAQRALGLPGNAPSAVETARNKSLFRACLRAASLPCPAWFALDAAAGDEAFVRGAREHGVGFPCVAKPLLLSASRGVIRAEGPAELGEALSRIRAILRTRPEYSDGVADADRILVESFVPGAEVALEGILSPRGDGEPAALHTLALFDKPDPLDGPFFEETIYVTPSRHAPEVQRAITAAVGARGTSAGAAAGSHPRRIAPRAVGAAGDRAGGALHRGDCARAPCASRSAGRTTHALEEVVLRQALGLGIEGAGRRVEAAGVMMLPIPAAGVLHSGGGSGGGRSACRSSRKWCSPSGRGRR